MEDSRESILRASDLSPANTLQKTLRRLLEGNLVALVRS
jgi:hypothetical protein